MLFFWGGGEGNLVTNWTSVNSVKHERIWMWRKKCMLSFSENLSLVSTQAAAMLVVDHCMLYAEIFIKKKKKEKKKCCYGISRLTLNCWLLIYCYVTCYFSRLQKKIKRIPGISYKLHHIIKQAAIPLYSYLYSSKFTMNNPYSTWLSLIEQLTIACCLFCRKASFHVSEAIQEDISNMESTLNTGT